jgi:hypothetical protein
MLDSILISSIRDIFLHQRPHVSISDATALLGWTRGEMRTAIAAGEVALMETPLGRWIWREELMAKALEQWPREMIDEALGADAPAVLPPAVQLVEVRARIPRYQLAMLEYLAQQDRTTIGDVLTRELESVASERAEELSSNIPGFATALAWPDAEAAGQPC